MVALGGRRDKLATYRWIVRWKLTLGNAQKFGCPRALARSAATRRGAWFVEVFRKRSRILNRARKEWRAVYGPSPSSSPLQGEETDAVGMTQNPDARARQG